MNPDIRSAERPEQRLRPTAATKTAWYWLASSLALAGLLVVLGSACGPRADTNAQNTTNSGSGYDSKGPAQDQASTPPAEAKPDPPSEPKPTTPKPRVDKPAEPARPATVTRVMEVPKGEAIRVCLQHEVSTEHGGAGQTFQASVKEPVRVNGVTVIPVNSTVDGSVTFSKRAPKIGGKAQMTLEFTQITTPDGKPHRIFADALQLEGESTTSGDVQKVVGGTVGGAIIGGVLGGKKGAIKGAAGGAAAGGIWAVATRGNDIVVDTNTEIDVTLARDLSLTVTVPTDATP